MKCEDVLAFSVGCVLAIAFYFAITFGISLAIAHLLVSMDFVHVGVGRLALLIWLVKLLMFNYNTSVNTRKHE